MKGRGLYASFLLFFLLLVLLVGATTVLAQSTVELAYDDGIASGSTSLSTGEFMAVRFSLPSGWSEGKLLTARIDVLSGAGTSFKVHVLDSDGSTPLITPVEVTPTATGWLDVDLSAFNLVVTDDFYIAVEFEEDHNPWIGYDKTSPIDGRSYHGQPSSWILYDDRDLMIRAVVQELVPVGGIVLPVYELRILVLCIATLAMTVPLIVTLKKRIS